MNVQNCKYIIHQAKNVNIKKSINQEIKYFLNNPIESLCSIDWILTVITHTKNNLLTSAANNLNVQKWNK